MEQAETGRVELSAPAEQEMVSLGLVRARAHAAWASCEPAGGGGRSFLGYSGHRRLRSFRRRRLNRTKSRRASLG